MSFFIGYQTETTVFFNVFFDIGDQKKQRLYHNALLLHLIVHDLVQHVPVLKLKNLYELIENFLDNYFQDTVLLAGFLAVIKNFTVCSCKHGTCDWTVYSDSPIAPYCPESALKTSSAPIVSSVSGPECPTVSSSFAEYSPATL